jgi:hypothetical protein
MRAVRRYENGGKTDPPKGKKSVAMYPGIRPITLETDATRVEMPRIGIPEDELTRKKNIWVDKVMAFEDEARDYIRAFEPDITDAELDEKVRIAVSQAPVSVPSEGRFEGRMPSYLYDRDAVGDRSGGMAADDLALKKRVMDFQDKYGYSPYDPNTGEALLQLIDPIGTDYLTKEAKREGRLPTEGEMDRPLPTDVILASLATDLLSGGISAAAKGGAKAVSKGGMKAIKAAEVIPPRSMAPIKAEKGAVTTIEQGDEAVRFGAKVNEEWAYSDELNDLLAERRSKVEGYRDTPEYRKANQDVNNAKEDINYLRQIALEADETGDLAELKVIEKDILEAQGELKDAQDAVKSIEQDWGRRLEAGEFGEAGLDPEELFQAMKDKPQAYVDMFDKDFYKRAKNIEAAAGKNTRRGLAPQETAGTVSLQDRAMYVHLAFNPSGFKAASIIPDEGLMKSLLEVADSGASGVRMSPDNIAAPFSKTATFGGKQVPIDAILKTAGHESGHDLQTLGDWMLNHLVYNDPQFGYYITRSDNPIARRFKNAMVEPKGKKAVFGEDDVLEELGGLEFDTWLASPMELHSDLMGVRTTFVNDIMQKEGVSMREAVKKLKANEDAYLDEMIKVSEYGESVIGRHFKPTTSPEEIKSILKLLPAVLTGALIVGQQSEEQTNLAYGGKIRPIKAITA